MKSIPSISQRSREAIRHSQDQITICSGLEDINHSPTSIVKDSTKKITVEKVKFKRKIKLEKDHGYTSIVKDSQTKQSTKMSLNCFV